jgi:hypothetical protein
MLNRTGFDRRVFAPPISTAVAHEVPSLAALPRAFARQDDAGTIVESGPLAAPFTASLFAFQ